MGLIVVNDVACPLCGAAVGRPCRTRTSKQPIPYPHQQRRLAFRVAKAAEPVRPRV